MPLYATMFNGQETVTVVLVTVLEGVPMIRTWERERLTVADFVGSCVLVAVTVIVLPVVGAVSVPLLVMLPAEAVQV